MDISKYVSNMLAVGSAATAIIVAIVVLVSYIGYRSDVMGAGTKQLFLVLALIFFVAAAITITFVAFPGLGKNLYLQINRIG